MGFPRALRDSLLRASSQALVFSLVFSACGRIIPNSENNVPFLEIVSRSVVSDSLHPHGL